MAVKKEKKKKSHVVRYYGKEGTDSEDFWDDIESLSTINLLGWQGNPPPTQNLAQERTVTLVDQKDEDEYRQREVVRVYGIADSKDLFAEVPMDAMIAVKTGRQDTYIKTRRRFDNDKANRTRYREVITIRIRRNGIDTQYLHDATDQDGRTTLQPPTDPKQYLEAVHNTKDMGTIEETIYVDLINKHAMKRDRGVGFQKVRYHGVWDNSLLYQNPEGPPDKMMPDAVEEKPGAEEPVQLDPLRIVINFGIDDSLAVEFGDGAEGPPRPKDTTKK